MPPPSANPINIGNSLFVSTTGNGGVRGRLDKPFSSINAAVTAALTGDTVFIYPNKYSLTSPIPVRPGVNFEFLGTGVVTSTVNVFSDKGQIGDSENIILASGWKFSSENGQVLEFAPKTANRKASLFFTFDTLSGGEPVMIYAGTGRIILDGGSILSPGTPVQVNSADDATIRNCLIRTDSLSNDDAILLWGNLLLENTFVHSAGGKGGTDGIGMDGGRLIARSSTIISEGANALTLRNSGTAHLFGCEVIGDDAALIAADGLVVESDDTNYQCTGIGAAVATYRNSPAQINLRGGRLSSDLSYDAGGRDINVGGAAGVITVAGTVWDRAKGNPTREWIPGTGWRP